MMTPAVETDSVSLHHGDVVVRILALEAEIVKIHIVVHIMLVASCDAAWSWQTVF